MKYLTNIRALGALVLLVAVSAAPPAARAAEVQVLSAGAMRSIVTDLGAAFEKETGHTLKFSFATVGQIKAKLADATPVDVVIMTDDAMREMSRQGAVAEGSWTAIGRTGIGLAVRDGAPKPDIGSPEALKQALLATKSLTYIDPAQGGGAGRLGRQYRVIVAQPKMGVCIGDRSRIAVGGRSGGAPRSGRRQRHRQCQDGLHSCPHISSP